MRKLLFLGLVLTSLSALITSCSDTKRTAETSTVTSPAAATDSVATPGGNPGPVIAAETYTCPMHPEVIANEPGKCPKCGMDLVKK
ncbi:heavy metal-binding domain-containing protein [Hymenobacter metallicola]|jgi:hypothetical protein|uniref:Heavy metal binding domain-containing protein n=1 Tax=Hymenobacter metallicola TaxID=2563114 RepID=A0A4Z0Q0R7_9BACT|nr:heavy metal-binding domain-containing protein [Hymenobacter metallicola]TGE22681.1 hypothetical protein E5K02_23395 [Hymenobacter metallicola]